MLQFDEMDLNHKLKFMINMQVIQILKIWIRIFLRLKLTFILEKHSNPKLNLFLL